MPNVPAQFPNIDLPGAEYFSLAPNASIALGGRRRFYVTGTPANAPATTNNVIGNLSFNLESVFTQTSGIYLHYFFLLLIPTPGGAAIQLNTVNAGLSLASPTRQQDYPLGNPVITTLNLFVSTVILTERDKLISAKDIQSSPATMTLSVGAQFNVNNSAAGAQTVTPQMAIIYTRLDGLTE